MQHSNLASSTRRTFIKAAGGAIGVLLSGCNGSGDSNIQKETITTTLEINRQPSSQSVESGMSAIFDVGAIGTQSITYQWFKNGIEIPSATDEVYTTTPLTLQDDDSFFYVLVMDSTGSIQSAAAIVSVTTKGITVDSTFATVDALSISI